MKIAKDQWLGIVKDHAFIIVCGVVVVAAVVALFYPLGALSSRLRGRMATELGLAQQAQQLGRTPISLPERKPFSGPVTPAIIQAKKQAQADLRAQASRIRRLVQRHNARGRVQFAADGSVLPLLMGVPEKNLLPQASSNLVVLADFRRAYERIFTRRFAWRNPQGWLKRLDAAMAPTPGQIQQILAHRLRAQAQLEGAVRPETGAGVSSRLEPFGNFQPNQSSHATGPSARLLAEVTRQVVFHTAQHCRIYADLSCFQERSFVQSDILPNVDQIYDAFVDTWLQNDVVNAIAATNAGSANVTQSPIKRLISISIGPDSAGQSSGMQNNFTSFNSGASRGADRPRIVGNGGLLVYGAANANQPATPQPPTMPAAGALPQMPGRPVMPVGGAMQPMSTMPPTGAMPRMMGRAPMALPGSPALPGLGSPSGGGVLLTGQASNARYQVVVMSIRLVLEPWAINRFIQELYRQNNGYTVLQIPTIHTVDPVEALTSGYVYGQVPVVRVNIVVEDIMFSTWHGRIMPTDYCQKCGVTPPPPGP